MDPRTGDRVVLRAEHVFGRNALRADTVLEDPEISLMHAVIRWRDGRWMLTNHSRNGTFVDGRALVPGEPFPLEAGAEVRLGRGDVAWRVRDVAEPVDSLVPPDPTQPVIALASHNLLPSSETPELCIYQARPGLWMLEQNGETRALKDGDRLQVVDAHGEGVAPVRRRPHCTPLSGHVARARIRVFEVPGRCLLVVEPGLRRFSRHKVRAQRDHVLLVLSNSETKRLERSGLLRIIEHLTATQLSGIRSQVDECHARSSAAIGCPGAAA